MWLEIGLWLLEPPISVSGLFVWKEYSSLPVTVLSTNMSLWSYAPQYLAKCWDALLSCNSLSDSDGSLKALVLGKPLLNSPFSDSVHKENISGCWQRFSLYRMRFFLLKRPSFSSSFGFKLHYQHIVAVARWWSKKNTVGRYVRGGKGKPFTRPWRV